MKIVITEPLSVSNEMLERLAQQLPEGTELVISPDRTDDAGLIERAKDADIVVIANQKISDSVLLGWKSMKLLVVAFTGYDHVNVELLKSRGIPVCNCAGYSTSAVADIVFAMTIDLMRNIVPCDRIVRQGGTKEGLVGPELEGKTFGIIGTGAIGSRVAKIADAFGCRVIACSRTEKQGLPVEYLPMDEVLRQSDILSVHVPSNAATRGMIGCEQLKLMKPTAILINTARGPVVDSAALSQALQEGVIAAAGVDVFNAEPPLPADEPLLTAPHTLLTPHIAFASDQAFEKRAAIVFGNILAWMNGQPQNLV